MGLGGGSGMSDQRYQSHQESVVRRGPTVTDRAACVLLNV